MAKGSAFIASSSTGHSSWPSRVTSEGSSDVLINGLGAHRVSDSWPVHCNPTSECHGGSTSQGSGTVFVNGLPLARIDDSIDCGDKIATGSSDVLVGD